MLKLFSLKTVVSSCTEGGSLIGRTFAQLVEHPLAEPFGMERDVSGVYSLSSANVGDWRGDCSTVKSTLVGHSFKFGLKSTR